jgi:hypothetical protein
MRFLTSGEADQFRSDFRQKEQEIQKNIGVYLSALVVAVGWVVGPQARPLHELVLGNHALNGCGLLIVALVNAIFATFLGYKGLVIQEYMQFVTFLTKGDSAFQYWEAWRRSKLSITKRWWTREIHGGSISAVPLIGAVLLMWLTWTYLHSNDETLRTYVTEKGTAPLVVGGTDLTKSVSSAPDIQEELQDLHSGIARARGMWWAIAGFHAVPLLVFVVSIWPTNGMWKRIRATKTGVPAFDSLEEVPTDDAATPTVLEVSGAALPTEGESDDLE